MPPKYLCVFFASLVVFTLTAHAKLVAWFPCDESTSAPGTLTEYVTGADGGLIGFDVDPGLSLITRDQLAPRLDLGSAYLIEKGAALTIGGGASVQPTDQFTFTCWYQPITLSAFDRIYESQVGNGNDQHGMRIDTAGSGNNVRVLIRDGNGVNNSQITHSLGLKNDGTWYFVAFRYDSAAVTPLQVTVIEAGPGDIAAAAVNSANEGAGSVTGAMSTPHSAAVAIIGNEVTTGGTGNGSHAGFDEIAFFDNSDGNGVLTDEQIAAVYNFGPGGVALIDSFTADNDNLGGGESATLSWQVDDSLDSLVLDDGRGNATDLLPLTAAGSGTTTVSPTESTSYQLTAIKGTGRSAVKARILVASPPVIQSFTVDDPVLSAAGGQSTTLRWSVIGATSLQIEPGSIDVTGMTELSVTPAETTAYMLTAANTEDAADAVVQVLLLPEPVPMHRYFASAVGNTGTAWFDEIGASNWSMVNSTLVAPLATSSANTNITAAYTADGGGGTVASFINETFSFEIWTRPGALDADHQAILESGGAQNGIGVLITDENLRVLGSVSNSRNIDAVVPIDGLVLDDFIQIVCTVDGAADSVDITVRDTAGTVRTVSATGDIAIGANTASIFGQSLATQTNLGGTGDAAIPDGLRSYAGEIAIINIYDQVIDTDDSQELFDRISTGTVQPAADLAITDFAYDSVANTITLEWNSSAGSSYDVQFSTDLDAAWQELEDEFEITTDGASRVISLDGAATGTRTFFRIREIQP